MRYDPERGDFCFVHRATWEGFMVERDELGYYVPACLAVDEDWDKPNWCRFVPADLSDDAIVDDPDTATEILVSTAGGLINLRDMLYD